MLNRRISSAVFPVLFAIIMACTLIVPNVALAARSVSVHSHPPSCSFLPASVCKSNFDDIISGVANLIVGLIGAIAVVMIIVSGVQMASAGSSPDRLKAAKSRLTNAILALVLLVSMRAILSLLGIAI